MVDLRATNDKLTDRAIRILVELCPPLTRAEASDLLDRAGGSVKTAIVMRRCVADRETAERLIAERDGMLRGVLDDTEPGVRAAASS